jgi:PAS domain S-box-containing protein
MTNEGPKRGHDERVLVLNRGEKVDFLRSVLVEAGISVLLCPDLDSLCRAARSNVSVLLLTDEGFGGSDTFDSLALYRQKPLSDIPILVLVTDRADAQRAEALGNVIYLTDPLSVTTLVSATRSALRHRRAALRAAEDLEEAKQTIASLQEKTRRFRTVFDRAAVGISLASANGSLLLVNRKMGEMLGCLPDDLQGRSFLELTHPEDRTSNETLFRELLRGGLDSYTLEKRLLRRDGTALWVELTCSIVPGSTGGARYIVSVVEDISEHRAAQDALRISEERLRLAAEAAHLGIWQWEIRDGHQHWDERCKALFGLPPEAPVSLQTWKDALHPDDRAQIEDETLLFISGKIDSKEYRVVWPDSSVHWLLARGTAHLDESGRPVRMVGIVMDITERKAAEEALRLGEERLRLAAEAAGIGIWRWNITGDRFAWDERCTALFGSPLLKDDFTLDDFLNLLHPDDRSRIRGRLPQALERSEINTELRTIWPDGTVHWLLVRGKTQFDAQGHPTRMNGILMDVTARKTAEELLQKAKEDAETANRTKSEFLANISHEIRTPMTVAMGAHELLQETSLTDDQRQYLEMAQVSLSTLLRLIDEILDYSRLESGKMLFEIEPFDLRGCLQDAVGAFNLEAGRKGLELNLEIAGDVPRIIRGDAVRLRQVLTNLIGNAIKFTPQGTVRVKAAVTRKNEEKEMLLFSVHDTGIGISPEKHHLLFQSFSQLDASHTRRYGGTGIGLALSRSIVERLGGEICMESEPGKGSAFYFTIPLERPAWAWAQASVESERREREIAHNTAEKSPRILMAEDDPMLRELLGIILGNRRWDVEEAGNGREALATWEKESFDLILMDVQMPEMDGLEATRTIREREKERKGHIPIIAMTAHVREEDRRQCLEAGMDDYLSKPVQMSDLYAKLEKYLGTKH